MTTDTKRKTGNEPLDGTDPGGTRPAPSHPKPAPKVESGDRNTMTDEAHGPNQPN